MKPEVNYTVQKIPFLHAGIKTASTITCLLIPGLLGSNDLRVGRKMASFQLFFSPGNRW